MADVTLSEAAQRYADSLKDASRTATMAEINRFVEWHGGNNLVSRLREYDIELYADRMGPSNPVSMQRADSLRGFLGYLKQNNLTQTNLKSRLRLRKSSVKAVAATSQDHSAVELTAEGVDALKVERESLLTQRAGVREEIRRAMLDKDFRENAPLDAAKDKQGHIEARMREIEAMLKRAVVVERPAGDRVQVGATVRVRNLANDAVNRFVIVGPTEANAADGRISSASPVGRSLLERTVGEEVEVTVPAGTMRFRIEEIGE